MEPTSRPFDLRHLPELTADAMRAAVACVTFATDLEIDVAPLRGGAAVFDGSPIHVHRYMLARDFGQGAGVLAAIMLNPSSAGATDPDPTITVWQGYARRLAVRRLLVVNLYALIATDPAELRAMAARDRITAIGPLNDRFLAAVVESADQTIVAWGAHASGNLAARVAPVVQLAQRATRGPLLCLGTTRSGAPVHPLRKSTNRTPAPWAPPAEAGT